MVMSTVVLCAEDPATRALGRMSFADPGWSVFECTADDVEVVVRSLSVDVVIVLGATHAGVDAIRAALIGGCGTCPPVVGVTRPESARDAAALTLGRAR